jgi:PEP-CTERM motif
MNIRSVVLIVALVGMQIALAVTTAHAGTPRLPEPTSLTLLGIGAGAVAVGAWWRNRK